jgi:hypothetical protein
MEAEGLQALASVQSEAMLFLDHLKQHLLQNPEPMFAVLRRVKPIWVSLK